MTTHTPPDGFHPPDPESACSWNAVTEFLKFLAEEGVSSKSSVRDQVKTSPIANSDSTASEVTVETPSIWTVLEAHAGGAVATEAVKGTPMKANKPRETQKRLTIASP